MNSAAVHQALHFSTTHAVQLHFYGSLLFGIVFCLIAVVGIVGVARTAHRRTRRDLLSATISIWGISLMALSTVLNAFVPLKPHHFIVIVPTSGLGAVLFVSGMLLMLISIFLMPSGEASKWLPVKEHQGKAESNETEIWPPAPKS